MLLFILHWFLNSNKRNVSCRMFYFFFLHLAFSSRNGIQTEYEISKAHINFFSISALEGLFQSRLLSKDKFKTRVKSDFLFSFHFFVSLNSFCRFILSISRWRHINGSQKICVSVHWIGSLCTRRIECMKIDTAKRRYWFK